MLYENLNLIFVHQRKCAGISIREALGRLPPELDGMYQDGVLSPEWGEHVGDYLRVAVIRNPWDRFVSGWRYCRSTKDRSVLEALRNLPSRGHDYRHVTRQQTETIFTKDGRIAVDLVLRFERLQDDFDALCDTLGIRHLKLPHKNKGSRGANYAQLFGPHERELFAQQFTNDVRMLGYSFERPGCPPDTSAIGERYFAGDRFQRLLRRLGSRWRRVARPLSGGGWPRAGRP